MNIQKRLFWSVVALIIVITAAILLPSMMFAAPMGSNDWGEFERALNTASVNFISKMRAHGFLIFSTFVLSIIIYNIFYNRDYLHIVHPIFDRATRSRLIKSALLSLSFVMAMIFFTSSETSTSLLSRMTNSPGGLFEIITGTLSVVGVYITLSTVLEVKNSVISFADFVNRALNLIDETDNRDYVRIMLHTPAPGCLVLPHEIWTKLSDRIQIYHRPISLTCLTHDAMSEWFDAYKHGLKDEALSIMNARIEEGLHQSDLVKNAVVREAEKRTTDGRDIGVLEATWNELPLCYYIANSKRAIVVAPFFLPRPGANIYAGNVHNRAVQMIGFETTDFHIVETVNLEIATRRNSIRAGRAEKKEAA